MPRQILIEAPKSALLNPGTLNQSLKVARVLSMRLGEMLLDAAARVRRGPGARARTAEGARRQARQDPGGSGLHVPQRDVLAALSDQLGRSAGDASTARPPSRPRSKGSRPRFLRQCRCIPVALHDSSTDRSRWPIRWISRPSSAVRDLHRPAKSIRCSRPSRKFSTPSTGITARPSGMPTREFDGDAAGRARIWSTCATWRARRRSSAW